MGYAKLADGCIERLDVREELEKAILQVFPPAVKYEIQIHRDYADALPSLLAQQNHVSEVFVNVLQNAREAMNGRGQVRIAATRGEDHAIVVTIGDDGPGIAPEHLERIFEPYFTTREQGSGLGLAIVKHNLELYGGRVRAESELGNGTRFILEFPAKALMRLRK
jgi:signal transduction histidine kinase